MTTIINDRFCYAKGYKTPDAAWEALCDLCAEGTLSEGEGRVERYIAKKKDTLKSVTRYAITIPF